MLEAFDLDPVDQRVYEALVDGSLGTPGELAEALDAEPAAVRQALGRLESTGLISHDGADPPTYAASSPEVVLGVLVLEQEQRLQRGRLYVEQLTARYHKALHRRDLAGLVELVSGKAAIGHRFQHLQRAARHEIRGIDRPPYAVPQATLNPVEAAQLARGIRYRIIYDSAGLDFHPLHEDLDRSTAQGEQARVMAGTPVKLVLIDDRYAMLPLRGGDTVDQVVIVHPSCLLDGLSALFESLWTQALPLNLPGTDRDPGTSALSTDPVGQPLHPDRPNPDEMRLLALLTAGLPDETIARHFGVSYRTLQRRIRSLLDRLGAQTRFQAGLRAAHLGWISPGN